MKIDALKAYLDRRGIADATLHPTPFHQIPCRIIRESDWRKIMAVVRAADKFQHGSVPVEAVEDAMAALRKHLEKRR